MTVLQRTDLTTSQKVQCAAAALAGQPEHGSKTALSQAYEISRPTVYAPGATAQSVLRAHFEVALLQGAAVDVRVDDAQLRRALVALRVLAPNAIRPIEDLLPLLYPGVVRHVIPSRISRIISDRRRPDFSHWSPFVGEPMRRRLRSRPPTAIAVIAMITALGVRVSLTTRLSLTNRRARLAIVGGDGRF